MKLPAQFALVVTSGAVVPLCFPPFGWWPLVLLACPLLLHACMNTSGRWAFRLGLLHGVIAYTATLSWLFRIFGVPAIALIALLALFTAVFCGVGNALFTRVTPATGKVVLLATLWTGIEFYRCELFVLSFPWITPGVALGPTYLSPLLGVYGTSFLILAASAGFLQRRTWPLAIALSLVILGLGNMRPARVELSDEESLSVMVVQSEACRLPRYVELTRSGQGSSPDLVIWPEYALPYDVRKEAADVAALTNLCAELDIELVLGTKTIPDAGKAGWRNTALLLGRRGVLGEYYKARPLHLFNDGEAGHDLSPTPISAGAVATPICFDCDYTEVIRKMTLAGAEFFAVPSFDAASWSAAQHLQHAAMFRLRAAESGRWLACAASSGVSQVIDPHGRVHAAIPPLEEGVVTCRIGRARSISFFVRVGWLFPWLTVVASILAVGRYLLPDRPWARPRGPAG